MTLPSTLNPKRFQRGQSLLEATVAISVFVFVVGSIIVLVLGVYSTNRQGGWLTKAVGLAQEGMEAARNIRDADWLDLTVGDHGLASSFGYGYGYWEFSGTQDNTDNFVRVISVEDVYRDGSGDISETGENPDWQTKKVSCEVSWPVNPSQTNTVNFIDYFTDWQTRDWLQTTDGDFGYGSFDNTEVGGTGEDAYVKLTSGTEGTFTSSVLDSGSASTVWKNIHWTENLPENTNITLMTKTGNVSPPDGSWSAGMTNASGEKIPSPAGRYLQYQANFTSGGVNTPFLEEVEITSKD